jgi:anti-sigma factor RsiW
MTRAPVTDADLHAYVDDQLEGARRAEVEAYLTANPEAARRVAEYRALNDSLRALYAAEAVEPVPATLRTHAARKRPWALAASIAAALLGGGVFGWQLHGSLGYAPPALANTIAQSAAYAHVVYAPEMRHPVEVAAAEETHLVQWLSKRLGHAVRAPQLGAVGFELVGGRLLPAAGGAAAMFMYQDPAGVRLTLYVRADAEPQTAAFRYARQDGLHVFYWADGPLGYALSGEIDKESLLKVATAVYEQLEH